MEIDIGARLKSVRQGRKLSQRELARRAGVTNATISLIEANQVNPSVGALKRVLDGIPMSLAEFFAFEAPAPRKAFYKADELAEVGKGKISYRQVGADLTGRALQILVERYAPGADTGRVMLSHDGEEGGVIIRGRLEVTVAGQVRVLGPGDAYYFESRQPHRFRNVGKEPCELISACTPPSF
ncbi:cupin domain-containing protein [uncultured Ferrovibrio sp.]|jgi:transcriptional regulator with XRE-family HTH domain|uniref:cupin domain-containing protein n=1 Tax=uncultured Ferrovibrio sp. TaxID=1576913 RepID=UPI00260C2346|nr:cupin domain-containing protein [uncultured Ferrovibrio sp.]